jgi:hypothetical protein
MHGPDTDTDTDTAMSSSSRGAEREKTRGGERTRGGDRSALGALGVTSCVVAVLAAVAAGGFWVHVNLHADTVRASKTARYTTMQARVENALCRNHEAMVDADATAFCAEAHDVLQTPFESAVQEEAWDNAVRGVYDTATSFSGLVATCICMVLLVGLILQCVWCILRLPSKTLLPG